MTFQIIGGTPEINSREKSCDQIHDAIDRSHLSRAVRNVKKFLNSMYQALVSSCACADVSKFKFRGVKMFLLNLWSECKNIVIKNAKPFGRYKQYLDWISMTCCAY